MIAREEKIVTSDQLQLNYSSHSLYSLKCKTFSSSFFPVRFVKPRMIELGNVRIFFILTHTYTMKPEVPETVQNEIKTKPKQTKRQGVLIGKLELQCSHRD